MQANPIFQDRTIDVGISQRRRCDGVERYRPGAARERHRLRRAQAFPYSGYEQYEFDVPTRTEGDAYARFLVRLDEMEQSMRDRRAGAQATRHARAGDASTTPRSSPPPKETIALSMEALIHHFKIVSEGFRVPPGDVYQAVEGPRGELGYYS